jgi:predicted phosphodiesterase
MAQGSRRCLEPVHDLGPLAGPLIAFGGPLGNIDALDALMMEARRLDVAPHNMFCTGDVAAYCADPGPCIETLRTAGIQVVMGNCEESLALDAQDCGCNFVAGSTCDGLANAWYSFTRTQIGAEDRAWMAALPRRLCFTMGGTKVAVIHGGARQINRYLFASDRQALAEESEALAADLVIAGHSGLPFTTDIGARLWHNPGALGLPANDGTPRVWYALISCDDGALTISHHPLDYDHRAQTRKMRAALLPEAYAQTLGTGLWPDTAILPEAEARALGQPLRPLSVTWHSPRKVFP